MKYEIEQFNPCNDALIFRKKYKTFRGAWNNCPRGDWMLWIAKRVGIDIRLLTLAKGYCAKTVIHLMTDQRSKDAVKAAIDYGHGKIDDVQLRNAAYAAYAAFNAAYAADAQKETVRSQRAARGTPAHRGTDCEAGRRPARESHSHLQHGAVNG